MREQTLSSSSWTYNVFLSFRGMDTRFGFTGHLYKALCDKGIKTFMDDRELPKGKKITRALGKAIKKSRIAIIIFSENYASSIFCLEELVKILELMEKKHRLILPIFYQVDPSDVRHQKEIFGEAFNNLIENRFKDDIYTEQKWRSALKVTADLSGWHFSDRYHDYEYKFIRQIVDSISYKITRIPLHVANYPVGLEFRVPEVMALLEMESNGGVNMLGIYGIGGIGKTTIASAMYNLIADHFEGVCFLDDIRGNSITKQDLAQLQKKLLADILGEKDIKLGSAKEGITIIKERLQEKKVLLILDDVDKLEHLQTLAGGLDWFGSGSRIIITTRDKHLLDVHCVKRKYEVVGLNDIEALELFSWNAFKKEKVDPCNLDLSEDVVSYSNGLPLALEVIGSNLCKRSRDVWESAVHDYQRTPNRSIYEVLKISYDSLEENQQKIFLDLACFFRGNDLKYVTDVLVHGRNLDPKYGINELVDKSLIKIDWLNRVRMHDLIQNMGREIVRQESTSRPGKRSRLWSSDDIIHVLEGNTGSECIEVMVLNLPPDQTVQWDGEAFKKMKNLQVLIVKSADFSTEIKYLPTSLRLFEWKEYPFSTLPSNFFPRNLVTLNMPNSCFILDKPLNNFKSLSHLDLSGNEVLTQLPDISGASNLIKLCLKSCLNLTTVHNSVGIHNKLKVLDAEGCTKLSIFPDQIMMKSLELLVLSHCSSLKIFPKISGKMETLTDIWLNDSGIESIPFSIQNLVGLQRMQLKGCNKLLRLPSSILTLPKLESLFVGDCHNFHFYHKGEEQKKFGPSVISHDRLICLSNCNLTDDFLPTRLPCLSDWEMLRLEFCNFMILPASIKEFPFLERLELIECKQLQEIRELPPKIKEVFAPNCTMLTSESLSILLSEKFHEVRAKFIFLPGARIPEWFHHCSKGPSTSFWFRKKIPSIALSAIIYSAGPRAAVDHLYVVMIVNGTQEISCYIKLHEYHELLMTDHILVFDLNTRLNVHKVNGLIINHGWNHVKISYTKVVNKKPYVKWMGVYVYKHKTNMQDVSFTRPIPKRKFDDLDIQIEPYLEYHTALLDKLDTVLPTWFYNQVTPIIWKAIWSMQTPPTIKILLWEICLHGLPTCQSLFQRKIIDSPMCPICGKEDETLEHLFLLCPWTRSIWYGSEFQWIVDLNSFKCIEVWLWERLQIIDRVHPNFNKANALLGCICWAI